MEEPKTKILFCSDEELEERRARIKAFRGPKERKYLLDNRYEQIRMMADMMILEGFSDAFTDELLAMAGEPGNEMTFDFIRFAALVMGEEFIRSSFNRKAITLEEACRMIRENYHDKEMQPFREIYENLDEKLRAAREGEEKVSRQIEVLKLQNEHAGEMYEERMESARMKFHYEREIAATKAAVEKERLEEKIKALSEKLSNEKSEREKLKKENEKLKRDGTSGGFLSRLLGSGTQELQEREDGGKKDDDGKESSGAEETATDERREFCIRTLGNEKFSGEQINLIVPCLQDENIPLSTLQILCRPDLPAENMNGLIRFIRGGKTNDGKQGS